MRSRLGFGECFFYWSCWWSLLWLHSPGRLINGWNSDSLHVVSPATLLRWFFKNKLPRTSIPRGQASIQAFTASAWHHACCCPIGQSLSCDQVQCHCGRRLPKSMATGFTKIMVYHSYFHGVWSMARECTFTCRMTFDSLWVSLLRFISPDEPAQNLMSSFTL